MFFATAAVDRGESTISYVGKMLTLRELKNAWAAAKKKNDRLAKPTETWREFINKEWAAFNRERETHKKLIDQTKKLLKSSFKEARTFVIKNARPARETEEWIAKNGGGAGDGMGWALARFSEVIPTLFDLFNDPGWALANPGLCLCYTLVPFVDVKEAFKIWGKWAFLHPETALAFYRSPDWSELLAQIKPDDECEGPIAIGRNPDPTNQAIKAELYNRKWEEMVRQRNPRTNAEAQQCYREMWGPDSAPPKEKRPRKELRDIRKAVATLFKVPFERVKKIDQRPTRRRR